ncbi:hypothetical protein [Variovorax sp. W2I14]|uniref:hypothetical protein n=1 Tax=Variovorax sp. W2I14 TaxID=3042290 RepID=UPI003D238DDE
MQKQEKKEAESESQLKEKEQLRIVIRETLGDRDHVKVVFDNDRDRFLITPHDYSLRTSTAFRKEFTSYFSQPTKWDSEQKAFAVPVAELPKVREAVKCARRLAVQFEQMRGTWLAGVKQNLWKAIDDIERPGFNNRLTQAMAYRTERPEEIPSLPPLPQRYEHPVLNERVADTREGKFSNGPIIDVNEYFVVQYSSRGNLQGDQVSKDPNHWITLHSTEKFLHTRQDWLEPKAAVARALGRWEGDDENEPLKRPWKSIEYNSYMKAMVFEYDKNIHSPKARKELSPAQVVEEQVRVEVIAQIPVSEEKKAKAPVRKKRQAQAMSM